MQKEQRQQHSHKIVLSSSISLCHLQSHELQKQIGDLIHQNKRKHQEILQLKPEFPYQLYKISEFQAISKSFGKGLLMRQLDRLQEQQTYLDSQLTAITQERCSIKEKLQSSETHHFELLKNIWNKDSNKKYGGTIEHINELNLMVGQVKQSILSLTKFEANEAHEFEDTYLKTFKILHERNRECQKCHEYKAKLEYLNGKLEGLEERLSKISDENIEYLEQINLRDDRLKKFNRAIRMQAEMREKVEKFEQQLIKKDQLIRKLKKDRTAEKEGKFINSKDHYELVIKSPSFDMSKYQQEIDMPLQCLINLIATEKSYDRSAGYDHKPPSSKSTQEQPSSRKDIKITQISAFGNENNIDHTKSDKIKPMIPHLQQHEQFQQIRRYSRNGSKRSHRSPSVHDEASPHRGKTIILTRDEEI